MIHRVVTHVIGLTCGQAEHPERPFDWESHLSLPDQLISVKTWRSPLTSTRANILITTTLSL